MSNLRNRVSLIGRLGSKPELKTLNGGFTFTRVSLATNDSYKDKNGEWKDNTQWHNVIAWGKSAERLAKNTDKGMEIAIEGRLVNNNYETKSGEKRFSTEIELAEFLIFAPKIEKSTK